MNKLSQSLHWSHGLLLISGAFWVVLYQTGWALSEIGAWSLVVWAAVALVGLLQTLLLYRLATAYPHKAGGTAVYALELFGGKARVLAFLSGWGYWLAWTPATVLNSYLCALLINNALSLSLHPTWLCLGIMAFLYTLNWFGLSRVIFSSYVLAVLVLVPLLVLLWLAWQTVTPTQWQLALNFSNAPSWVVFLKWFFVIAWTGYGLEMISSIVAETKSKPRPMFVGAALWSVLAFVGIPLLLALLSDWSSLANDPFSALQPLFSQHLGPIGSGLLMLFLLAALLYSALAILIPSTRTLYQMSHDGLLPPYFGSLNRYKTPQGSLVLDIILNVGLLLIFGANLISILAVANVGYMVVFILLPVAYIQFLKRQGQRSLAQYLLAGLLFLINLLVMAVGGAAWGALVFGVGWLLVGVGVPLYYLSGQRIAQHT